MRGHVRGVDGADAEALVRERLRSIVAAATPRVGWVPERIADDAARVIPPIREQTWRLETSAPDPEPPPASPDPRLSIDEPDRAGADASALPPGRHRGSVGSEQRLRWEPGRPGALAMCLVAVLAALLATGVTWWSRPTPSTVDEVNAAQASAAQATGDSRRTDGERPTVSSTGPDAGSGSGSTLVVSVIGQVHQPGLVSVASGARVADAIAAAGGALPEADLSSVNLARLVVDGEQIAVGIPGSALPDGGDPADSGGLINLNTASQAELEELPGIGPVLAQRIIEFRADNGGFTAVEQLREVSGIGPTVFEDIVDLVTV